MASNHLEDLTDSYVDISLAAMERDVECRALSPGLMRIAELGITQGDHYLQLSKNLGSASLLVIDFEPHVTDGLHLREAIISRASHVTHYVYSIESGEFLKQESDIKVYPENQQAVFDEQLPPLVWARGHDEYKDITRDAGGVYNHRTMLRAVHLDLSSEPEYETDFVTDTEPFFQSSFIRTRPVHITRRSHPS